MAGGKKMNEVRPCVNGKISQCSRAADIAVIPANANRRAGVFSIHGHSRASRKSLEIRENKTHPCKMLLHGRLLRPRRGIRWGQAMGGGCPACCASDSSIQAHAGACVVQMVALGAASAVSSSAPLRTMMRCGLASEALKSCVPQAVQKRRCITLPLAAMLR
jgi:hypothetical protein